MKKLLWILAFVLPFVFTACSNDDEDTLEGTVWEHSTDTKDFKYVATFYFEKSAFRYVVTIKEDLDGDGILEEETDETNGTYTYKNSTVTLDGNEKDLFKGRVSGNKLTFETDVIDEVVVFTKK